MERFILQLGNMSLQASIVICVVLLVRILFAKLGIAKKYMNLLWILPYLCMICPWKLEGDFGFWRQYGSGAVDSTYEAKEDIIMTGNANIAHTVADGNAFDSTFDNLLQNVTNNQVNDVSGMDVVQLLLAICCIVWLAGIIGLLIYSADAHLKLHKKLICCMHLTENIYLADDITVPFVMGVWKPRIYLPSHMPMDGFHYVIAHEKTHIHRRDPLKKILAYIITCLHWFNPLAWVAFYFFGKDMEMACDEETVLGLGISHKQDYATVLLSMSSGKKLFLGAPLAFGEGNVKGRIKNIVKYKKTWHVLSLLAIAVIMVLAVGFMTKVPAEEAAQQVTEIVPDIEALARMEPHELTMEELLELYNNGTLKEIMAALPFTEELVYTNLERLEHSEYALNYTYTCDLEYDGEIYPFRASYYKPDKVEGREIEANQMDMVYLNHKASGDMCMLYIDRDPAFSENLEAFLELEYNIEQYLTFELPKETWLGEFKIGFNDIYDGCLILGNYEELPHSDSMGGAWASPGSIGLTSHERVADSEIMKFEQGKPVSVRWYANHSGFITKGEYLDGCDMPAILYEAEFDLFTAADSIEYSEKNNIPLDKLQTVSKYYYVFFGTEDSRYIYYVALNQAYFTKEDVIALARSVKFTEQ